MYLLGEALTTAVGGYLMYKGFGTKGLIMSLGVSMLAQLAAITLNLADGGVEIDDPELWIQSAFTTALAGVGGGILAYKGTIPVSTGKGVGLGLLVGLSLTLSAITIGEITAKGEVTTASIFTGIGSVLAAAGFGFMVGGPLGAAIGAAVGLTINVVGAVVGTMVGPTVGAGSVSPQAAMAKAMTRANISAGNFVIFIKSSPKKAYHKKRNKATFVIYFFKSII